MATTQQINKTLKEWQNVGYMARVNYNYANKYYLTANFRRDGFSGFAKGSKWANFPGVSAAWTLSQECNSGIELLEIERILWLDW